MRWQTTALLNTMMPKGKKLKVTDLMELPDEKAAKASKPTVTDQQAAEFLIAEYNR